MTDKLAQFPSLAGKSVFITGGGSGIGECLVSSFAEQGAKVAFVDIDDEPSEALCKRLNAAGKTAVFQHCDIRDVAALQATMHELAREIGDFDILVNNAANDDRHRMEDVTLEYWNDRIAINQRPYFFTCQAAVPGMKKKGAGSIINLGSMSWHIGTGGFPAYTTAKASVNGLTRGLARDLGPHRIRVNTVTPGWVMTERQVQLWLDDNGKEDIQRNQCLQDQLLPWHIARMVLFLAADDSAMCTGQEYIIDGGWS